MNVATKLIDRPSYIGKGRHQYLYFLLVTKPHTNSETQIGTMSGKGSTCVRSNGLLWVTKYCISLLLLPTSSESPEGWGNGFDRVPISFFYPDIVRNILKNGFVFEKCNYYNKHSV